MMMEKYVKEHIMKMVKTYDEYIGYAEDGTYYLRDSYSAAGSVSIRLTF